MPNHAPSWLESMRERGRRLGLRRFWVKPEPPTNWRRQDTSPASIRADAAYGVNTGLSYLSQLRSVGLDPAGRDIIEIGPGPGFGGVAVLTSLGARGAVADRWLAPWQDDYHVPYYSHLADLLAKAIPDADVAGIRAIADKGYAGSAIELIASPAETLHQTTHRTFDAVFSNAVLEHVQDINLSARALHAITRDGGYGFHQVDFRDHRNFDRPLEHLIFSAAVFKKMSERVHTAYGSQCRPEEYVKAFEESGFKISSYQSNAAASDSYLDKLLVQLAKSAGSPYRSASREEIRDLGGLFIVKRLDAV